LFFCHRQFATSNRLRARFPHADDAFVVGVEAKNGGCVLKKSLSLLSVVFILVAFALGFAVRPMVTPAVVGPEGVAGTTFEWTLQTSITSGHPQFPLYLQWAQDIHQMSGGRLQITIHPVGEIMPLMELLTSVTNATLDGAITWGPFWRGLDSTLTLACGQTSGLTAMEFDIWLNNYGGLELIQEAYARHNIHWLPALRSPPETFLWAHQPIRTVADLQGLKVRAGGFSLDAFTALGAAATFMPGGETPPALMKRVIDAGEFGTLSEDMALGFHEAARYAIIGARAPVMQGDLMINADRWKTLPVELQNLVTTTIARYGAMGYGHLLRLDQESVQKAKARGNVFVEASDELVQAFRSALDGILDEEADGNANFAKIWQSLREFRTSFRDFNRTLYPWD